MPTLICDCNQTIPLKSQALGEALNESLTQHSALCRREAASFQKAIQSGDDVVIACTQEKRLFAELAEQTVGAVTSLNAPPVRALEILARCESEPLPKKTPSASIAVFALTHEAPALNNTVAKGPVDKIAPITKPARARGPASKPTLTGSKMM